MIENIKRLEEIFLSDDERIFRDEYRELIKESIQKINEDSSIEDFKSLLLEEKFIIDDDDLDFNLDRYNEEKDSIIYIDNLSRNMINIQFKENHNINDELKEIISLSELLNKKMKEYRNHQLELELGE